MVCPGSSSSRLTNSSALLSIPYIHVANSARSANTNPKIPRNVSQVVCTKPIAVSRTFESISATPILIMFFSDTIIAGVSYTALTMKSSSAVTAPCGLPSLRSPKIVTRTPSVASVPVSHGRKSRPVAVSIAVTTSVANSSNALTSASRMFCS